MTKKKVFRFQFSTSLCATHTLTLFYAERCTQKGKVTRRQQGKNDVGISASVFLRLPTSTHSSGSRNMQPV